MKVFIRIDDVGNWDDDEKYLVPLLNTLIQKSLSFNLEVVPSWLTKKSINYLRELLRTCPDLIEIDQHGYSHDLSEFTRERSADFQRNLLLKGMKRLQDSLGVKPCAFTPPEHIYSEITLDLLDELGFQIISKQVKTSHDGKVFYALGKGLRKNFLLGKKVSYHGQFLPNKSIQEWSISVESSRNNIIKHIAEIKADFETSFKHFEAVGFLIHHSILNSEEQVEKMNHAIEYIAQYGSSNVVNFSQLLNLGEVE